MAEFLEQIAGYVREFGPMTVAIVAVIIVALIVIYRLMKTYTTTIDRISKAEADKVESHLDDTETLRTITKEDRSYLVKAQERNELLVQSNLNMMKELGEIREELIGLRMKVSGLEEIRQNLEDYVAELKRELETLRLRIVDLESINNTKDAIITQLRDRKKKPYNQG